MSTPVKEETPEEVAARIAKQYSSLGTQRAGLRKVILAALYDRDERAAKIAEAHEGHGSWCSSASGDCQSLTVKAIATAIRGRME